MDLGLRLSPRFSGAKQSGLLTHIAATGRRFVVHAEEKLTAFEFAVSLQGSSYKAKP
jgi:hypothetical protein